jgi:hypothetical protein
MDRCEASALALAKGAFSVFAVAVVPKRAPWQVTRESRDV